MVKCFSRQALFFIVMISVITSGCAKKFIVVQSSVIETVKNENVAEVTATPRYSKLAPQIKSVALNAPSSCSDKSASAMTGKAEGKGEVVKTRCGVEMAEIERALVSRSLKNS